MQHLSDKHGKYSIVANGESALFTSRNIYRPGVNTWVKILSYFDYRFMVVLKKPKNDQGLKQYFAFVRMIGTPEQAKNFAYRLELVKGQQQEIYEATTRSIREKRESEILNSDCLVINMEEAKLFADEDALTISVTIQLK